MKKNKTIVIDAAHPEEKRVAVLENGILQDFNREAPSIKQIKGNIYYAKITRVEASLQACFVDYGSEKHGFLPFSDIHPNYFEISEEEKKKISDSATKENESEEEDSETNQNSKDNKKDEAAGESIVTGSYSIEDETETYRGNISKAYRRFNIQDVVKPGTLVLVQATKEERGNKGASMTTYISIAGKYCVLMANTPNKGGVSRKVDNFRDRKLLKSIIADLNVENDRSIIIRTAGVGKKPEEIKADYEYLEKLWSSIKETTKESKAPSFIHAEDDIIKKCIRDVYDEDTREVLIEGEDAFRNVENFAKMTIGSEAKNIKLYQDRVPIFNRLRVEQQITGLYEKEIHLPSGGSIVIDHAEALVAIDVNSGKSTKESAVENMAFNTNLEAVKEIARQLRLRDLAGLVVIDFIDMSDSKNRRNVERAMRDELQNDRARIQLGRISIFGLLEMSRQRLGASFFETITQPCPHCSGTGFIRSVEIVAVSILRAIRHACNDKQTGVIYIYTKPETIAYMMNYKKHDIATAEKNYNVHIFMHSQEETGVNGFQIKKRKGLSDEESREIEMKVQTGKVNELGIERIFLEKNKDIEPANDDNDRSRAKFNHKMKSRHQKPNRRRHDRRHNNRQNTKSKGLLGSIVSALSK